jgi:hypothetical protein
MMCNMADRYRHFGERAASIYRAEEKVKHEKSITESHINSVSTLLGIPLTGREGRLGCETSRLPHFLYTIC